MICEFPRGFHNLFQTLCRFGREAIIKPWAVMGTPSALVIWLVLFVLPLFVILILPFVALALILRAWMRRRARKKAMTTA